VKILFTSDVHSSEDCYRQFAGILKHKDYDVGVIAGDLWHDVLPEAEIARLLGLDGGAPRDERQARLLERYTRDPWEVLPEALEAKEREIKDILFEARKPIFIVPGNHDRTSWASERNLYNVHGKRMSLGRHGFVGYRFTEIERSETEQERDFEKMHGLLGADTILVTHAPPYGILDRSHGGRHIGSRAVRRRAGSQNVRLHLFGHVHEDFGRVGKYYNGAFPRLGAFVRIELSLRG
jgi:Icc-related predicted phosphoesterase